MSGCMNRWLLLIFLTWTPLCQSMQTHFEALEKVAARASLAVVVDVVSVEVRRDSPFWQSLSLRVSPVTTIFGQGVGLFGRRCRYEEGVPHRRHGREVSPLATGSGMEFQVVAGDRVLLLLDQLPAGSGDCRVLRIEPPESQDAVRALGQRK